MSAGDIERKLGITVEATDKASGKLSNVKREVAGIEGAAAMGGSKFSRFVGGIERGASRMKSAIGGAASHAKRQLSGIASGALGLLGVGGIFAGGALLTKSLQEAAAFGANVEKVAKTTGLATTVASAMVDTLDKWGLSSERLIPMLGKLEKNVGAIAAKKAGLSAFKKEFGVALTSSNGKILDANQLLLKSADYFNSNASATKKATFLSKLWGKSWQDMIPILSKGSAFIKAQEANSIHLTQTQLDNITKYRTAQREFQDTMGDLEVKIGANIMPRITGALTAVGAWLDTHSDEVATFFGNAADIAGNVAGAAIDVFSGIKAGWESLPEGVRDLLVKGLVADRAVKFLFGFSPSGLAVKLGEEAVSTIAKAGARSLGTALAGAGIGKLFVQPVFVTNQGFGGGGGGLPGVLGGAGAGAGGLSATAIFGTGLVAGAITIATGMLLARVAHEGNPGFFVDPTAPGGALGSGYHKPASQSTADRRGIIVPPRRGDDSDIPTALQKSTMVFDARSREEQAKLALVRESSEQNRIAIQGVQRIQESSSAAIVAAIHGIRLIANLTIPVTLSGSTRTVRVSGGTTLSRYAGKIVPID